METKQEKLHNVFNYLKSKGIVHTQKEFSEQIIFDKTNLSSAFKGSERYLTDGLFKKICDKYPFLNIEYFLENKGNMLKSEVKSGVQFYSPENSTPNKKLIPFYDDVASVGGYNSQVANVEDGVSMPSEYIDTGDWFREATSAIRHYGESMVEYPEGCILALKNVQEKQLIVWGRDYVIETSEYRITKRVQRGKTEEYIRAYSSNTETYPDGQLIHEPLDICWKDIRNISLILGYVVKKNGGTMVFSNLKSN